MYTIKVIDKTAMYDGAGLHNYYGKTFTNFKKMFYFEEEAYRGYADNIEVIFLRSELESVTESVDSTV
jgi:hypothetical protein